MNLLEAEHAAQEIQEALYPHCLAHYCQIAGSIRRRKPEYIKDVEIVAVSRPPVLEFGSPPLPALHKFLEGEYQAGRISPRKNRNGHSIAWGGLKYRAIYWGPEIIPLDIFIVTPPQWGAALLIRTGPAEFSHALVTPKSAGGLMPEGMREQDFRLWDGVEALDTPTEEMYFAALGLPFVQPWSRK